MSIENAKYNKDKLSDKAISINCIWDGKLISVPLSEDNRHYVEIMRQVAAGELTIADAD